MSINKELDDLKAAIEPLLKEAEMIKNIFISLSTRVESLNDCVAVIPKALDFLAGQPPEESETFASIGISEELALVMQAITTLKKSPDGLVKLTNVIRAHGYRTDENSKGLDKIKAETNEEKLFILRKALRQAI